LVIEHLLKVICPLFKVSVKLGLTQPDPRLPLTLGFLAEVVTRMYAMGCYNLLADFRETVLPRSWFEKRLRAVRDFVFLVGADLISQGRRVQIRFAMPQPDRPEFLRRLRTVSDGLPIAAQLEWSLSDQTPTHPTKSLPQSRSCRQIHPATLLLELLLRNPGSTT
jgi:hypothetical protein